MCCGWIRSADTAAVRSCRCLFVIQQLRLLRLKFRIVDGTGVLGFLEVNQLLANGRGIDVVFFAAAELQGDAAVEQERSHNGNRAGQDVFFHIVFFCDQIRFSSASM